MRLFIDKASFISFLLSVSMFLVPFSEAHANPIQVYRVLAVLTGVGCFVVVGARDEVNIFEGWTDATTGPDGADMGEVLRMVAVTGSAGALCSATGALFPVVAGAAAISGGIDAITGLANASEIQTSTDLMCPHRSDNSDLIIYKMAVSYPEMDTQVRYTLERDSDGTVRSLEVVTETSKENFDQLSNSDRRKLYMKHTINDPDSKFGVTSYGLRDSVVMQGPDVESVLALSEYIYSECGS
jgi:hypothetical protein